MRCDAAAELGLSLALAELAQALDGSEGEGEFLHAADDASSALKRPPLEREAAILGAVRVSVESGMPFSTARRADEG
jgi:hypothetical protein